MLHLHVCWTTVIPQTRRSQMSAIKIARHNLHDFSECADVPNIKPQMLLHWTSRFLRKQCDQEVIVQRPAKSPTDDDSST